MQKSNKNYEECIDCKSCMKGCLMLHEFTESPKSLLLNLQKVKPSAKISFSCATCNYCHSVCPTDISFKELFYEAKKEYAKDEKLLKSFGYKAVLFHQKNSFSKLFTAKTEFTKGEYANMAFMPGCALASYSPSLVQKIYTHLQGKLSGINILQQCCAQPTRVVGDMSRFEKLYGRLESDIKTMEVDTIVTACENCYMSLKTYSPHIKVLSLYELLADIGIPKISQKAYTNHERVALHDPCPTRHQNSLHVSVRILLNMLGLEYEEFRKNREKTECCGSGGMLELTNPKLAKEQMSARAKQTSCQTILSYCQSCAESMSRGGKKGVHILDLIFATHISKSFEQDKKGVISKWYNRYKSKKEIERVKEL